MHLEVTEELRVRTLQAVFDIAAVRGGVRKLCREYGIAKLTYYYWKKRYELSEKSGLYRHKPIPYSSPRKTRPEVAEKVFETAGGKPDNQQYDTGQITKLGQHLLARHINSHTFRHTLATQKIRSTKKIQAISEYLGHATVAITLDMYTHEQLDDHELFSGWDVSLSQKSQWQEGHFALRTRSNSK